MKFFRVCAVLAMMLLATSVAATDQTAKCCLPDGTIIVAPQPEPGETIEPMAAQSDKATYDGNLRLAVVEIDQSRWGYPYAFLSYALNQDITVPDLDSWSTSLTWDGGTTFNNVSEDNIMVIAFLTNETTGYTDAVFAATPYENGVYEYDPSYTHTVFVEVGTSTT